jgi:hypothetical protein
VGLLWQIVFGLATIGMMVGVLGSFGLVIFGVGTIMAGGRARDGLRMRLGWASLFASVLVWVVPVVVASLEATTHHGRPGLEGMWVLPRRTSLTLGGSAWLVVVGVVLALRSMERRHDQRRAARSSASR